MAYSEQEAAPDTGEYPVLKTSPEGDYIVLFYQPGWGSVVWASERSGWRLGEGGDSEWDEDNFVSYRGTVTITE